jgi:hypothetical protein
MVGTPERIRRISSATSAAHFSRVASSTAQAEYLVGLLAVSELEALDLPGALLRQLVDKFDEMGYLQ